MSREALDACRTHVDIDLAAVDRVLPWLAPGPPNTAWRDYVGPVDHTAPDLGRLYYELALTISQFGGFIEPHLDGSVRSWKQDGSGVKALLATMALIRRDEKLPGIDIHEDNRRHLTCYFIASPFTRQRVDMLSEIAMKGGIGFFERHLRSARRANGTYCFTVLHLAGLAQRFPLSFGGDAPFYKKASLLLLTMEMALNQLGQPTRVLSLPPADYRIPQILEGLGMLKFSSELSTKIDAGHLFQLKEPEIRAIRAMTVEAVGHIHTRYESRHGRVISCAELDGMLYLLSRNRGLMSTTTMRPHMRVATMAF